MRKIYAIFTIGYLLPAIVGFDYSSVCLKGPFCLCKFHTGYEFLFCSKVVNFQPIYELMHSQTFPSFKIFLNHCSLATLPSHAFENVSVVEFTSYCPFSDIPKDAFDGSVDLTSIMLAYTTFPTIPYGLQNLTGLRTLVIRDHKLVSLNHELWNLQSLTLVNFISGTLQELAEDVFAGTPYIADLNLSYNRLKYLHPNTLKPLMLLRRIFLNGNQILSVDGLLGNLNLEEIDLSYNNLTTVDYVFSTQMLRLKSLKISRNPIKSFGFLSGEEMVFPNLQNIEMTAINCSEISPTFFSKLPRLVFAKLGLNRLQSIPKTLFRRLLLLAELPGNSITSIKGLFDSSPQLKELHLSNNRISDVSHSFQNLKKLEYLFLDKNDMKRINNGDFEGLEHLNSLNLSSNQIELIESESFSGLKSLYFLYLSENCFKHLNRSLQNLPLFFLHVESACLENVSCEDFFGLTKLESLYLNNNSLTSVDGVFRDLESLETLNISGNKLTTLSRDTFAENLRLKTLWLATGNHLHCDCRLRWLIEYHAQMNHSVLQDNPLCHFPLRLRGTPINELTVKDLTNWPEDCPVPCRCECVDQGRTIHVRADCSYRKLIRIPNVFPDQLQDLDLSSNELESLSSLGYEIGKNLIALNLENNRLTTLESIPQNLVNLRISGNLMNRLPRFLLLNESLSFEMLTLANNPWICDCQTLDFRKWLLSMGDVVIDVNDTKCGPGGLPDLYDKVLIDLTDTDLCPSGIVFHVSLVLGLLGTLLLVSSTVLMFSRYRLYIKAWLYTHGHTWVKENDPEEEKHFDAFLSYHESEEEFVFTDIVPKLEEVEPKFTLCIPNRDIIYGVFSAVTQMEAIRDSKRVIVILTQEYIDDAFCMSIFQQAYQHSLEDKVHRLILIKVGDIRKSEDMNPELLTILESSNYIPWQGILFLERLYYAMPKQMSRTVVCDEPDIELAKFSGKARFG